ncbi:MAG: ESX-1 secretion-associated protein [Actinomycetia bacterium]|nr:ESX-1 secretion-associated protein [Actinomycetes bacterium]
MSRDELKVTTAHLRELAAKHGQTAAEVTSATETVSGVDTAIRKSHGLIAWSSAGAVEAIQEARRGAGKCAADESEALSENLISAAGRYEATDHASGASLDRQLPPGPTAPPPEPPR